MHEFFGLIIRHWNSLVRTFNSSGPFLPFLLEDDAGVAHANDWAQGFPIHPHMLRHATGYKLANDGQDTRALQHYLGRKNIMHTVRYTQLSPERFENFWQD
jgi:integrase